MKKWIWVMTLLAVSLLFVACGSVKITEDSQKQLVASYMDALKAGDFTTAKTFLETVPENFDYNENEIMKTFFSKLSYEVVSASASGETGEVTLKIKLPNTTLLYDSMMDEIGEDVQKLQASDDTAKNKASEMMVKYMLGKLTDENVTLVENQVKVTIKKGDKALVLVPNDEFSKALSGVAVE